MKPKAREHPAFARFLLGLLLILLASLALFYGLMHPALADLSLMTTFLLVAAGLSAAAGYAAYRLGWIDQSPSLRLSLLAVNGLASGLAFASVWVTARLMFASEHDLLLATVLLVFAAGIAAVLGTFLSSRVIHRIRQLEAAARQIERGELSQRAVVTGRDEVAALGRTFDRMAAELERAAARQEELERMRRDLVAWAGHDLQTPLTSIRAILEAVADGVVEDPPTLQRYLQTAQRNIRDLSTLIDDLFEVAQMQGGSLRLHLEPASLNDLISDTVESFSGAIASRGIQLEGNVAPGVDPVVLDPARIGRVLSNLLSNALRHTPDGGRITIEAAADSAEVQISVRDTGEGIAPEDLPHVFESFYRGERSRGRASGGSGLGLAIARGFVEAHGGRIAAESPPGQGCTVSFTLPRKQPPADRPSP
ncbi:MAG TPA: HAMP domain-containing sensor histidine kinase [Anaerolineales bacterium]|nr:HAMP domain-containing sensor histidine kinase [Anaerolineales bacterium]